MNSGFFLRKRLFRRQARAGDRTVGSIVCKAERESEDDPYTGYIAMLAVDTAYRKHGIGERRPRGRRNPQTKNRERSHRA